MSHSFLVAVVSVICLSLAAVANGADGKGRWKADRAQKWYDQQPWLVGCNFMPSTATNQLEMWQADSFDAETIDRELGYAESIGMNTVRVFLHDLAYTTDPKGFLLRMDAFLKLADKHKIKPMFVFFDSCWNPYPKAGKQASPKPFTHNAGWLQSPGKAILSNEKKCDALKPYVQAVLRKFKDDDRVLAWDLFNEPENTNGSSYGKEEPANKDKLALSLMQKSFAWARQINPSQPLTVCTWAAQDEPLDKLPPVARFAIENSDVLSFHRYANEPDTRRTIDALKKFDRPLLCTEYMARPAGSTFEAILPLFKREKVAAYNWGFVDGKTQTIYPWDSWGKAYTGEPPVWFHDIFRKDGTPYIQAEVDLIKELTGKK